MLLVSEETVLYGFESIEVFYLQLQGQWKKWKF